MDQFVAGAQADLNAAFGTTSRKTQDMTIWTKGDIVASFSYQRTMDIAAVIVEKR